LAGGNRNPRAVNTMRNSQDLAADIVNSRAREGMGWGQGYG